MPRNFKVEVAAINIRIRNKEKRDYVALIQKITQVRQGIRVRGDTHIAITSFNKKDLTGTISKYTEIDINGDWFDQDKFNAATPEQLEEINIPAHLKPNFASFYFQINPDLHVVAFTSYAGSKALSPLAVEKYFKGALTWEQVKDEFGRVEADLVKDYGAVEHILELPNLKELEIILRPPNADDVNGELAAAIEESLRDQNADEYEQILRSKGKKNLKPNDHTRALANVAAENGEVKGKNLEKGVKVPYTTDNKPLIRMETHPKEASDLSVFRVLARKVFDIIQGKRQQVKGDFLG